jgi:hypothetical protein
MREIEEREQSYLFKLCLSKNVKRHLEQRFQCSGGPEAGQGWQGMDSQLALSGGKDRRRVIVLRRPRQGERLLAQADSEGQQGIGFIEGDRKTGQRITGYE